MPPVHPLLAPIQALHRRIRRDVVRACEEALREAPEPRRVRADVFLRGTSWDRTWAKTAALLDAALNQQPSRQADTAPSAELGMSA